jgi:hypothetical protein
MGKIGKILIGIGLIVAGIVLAPFTGGLSLQLVGIGIGLVAQGVIGLFTPKPGTKSDVGRVNVRVAEPIRWLNAGRCKQGGAVLFAEFDTAGNLWYLLVHSDSILVEPLQICLDDIPVTLDGSGFVTNKEFRLTAKKEAVTTDGAGIAYVQVWTTTYSESNPTPPAISALAGAFPSKWTSNHKLVGTTYSVIKMNALKNEDRYKLYKFRGPLGLGEPSMAIVGKWSHAFDPRDEDQINGTPTTYLFTRNAVLQWAWFRTHRYGRNKPRSSINWDKVAEQAEICDQVVEGLVGDHVRYQCDISIADDQARINAEQDILMTMDAQLVFDDDGKVWPRVGYYEAPTLVLTRNRDIIAMESLEAQDGESETQGVIVRYTDPDADYAVQPSAPWYNPLYYNEGEAATFLTFEALAIQDHNQAMRIAKAIGMRSQPLHRIAPTMGLRGLKARQERIANLNYDNTFAGEYEITSPVEVDPVGIICGTTMVPVDPDRWDLLPGEEKPKSVTGDIDESDPPDVPTGVTLALANGRLEATFTPPAREDIGYEFQYIPTADLANDTWATMTTRMDDGFAYSGTVVANIDYTIRYRAIAASGRVSDWSSEYAATVTPTGSALQMAVFNSWIVEQSFMSIAADGTLTILDHTRRYSDGWPDQTVQDAIIATGLVANDVRSVAYDDPNRTGGTVTYNLYTNDNDAHASAANPGRHYMGYVIVPSTGSFDGGGGGVPGGYYQYEYYQ